MNVLVIGGTKFVGRTVTDALLTAGHAVTHFNRGESNPDIFPSVETIYGDRMEHLDRLAGRKWDAVIDTCAYVPRAVRLSGQALMDSVEHYLYVSTISVYDGEGGPHSEDGQLASLEEETEVVDGRTYGGLKVQCEKEIAKHFGERLTIVRPGLIVGPHDHTDRFAYWPLRFKAGGRVAVPACPGRRTTALDVRDFADFMVLILEKRLTGTFNVDRKDFRLGDLIRGCQALWSGEPAWIDEDTFRSNGVEPWRGLPCWLEDENSLGDPTKALSAGLVNRPIEATLQDTLSWALQTGRTLPLGVCMTPEQESDVLKAWLAETEA